MNFKTCYHLPIKFMPSFIKNSNALPGITNFVEIFNKSLIVSNTYQDIICANTYQDIISKT